MKITFDYAAISDVGMVRKNNEDNIFVPNEKIREPKKNIYSCGGKMVEDKAMFCVCDGMGGHSAGEVASYIAVQQVNKNYDKIMGMIKSPKAAGKVLRNFISNVNDNIYNTTEERPELKSMGTTMVGLYFMNGGAYFFNIGDSRAYVLKNNKLLQLTSDHADSENKHALTRFLGMSSEYGAVYPDVANRKTTVGIKSRFLLCSDGLTDMVDESIIKNILTEEKDVSEAAKKLVDTAKKNGGRDNITVLIIDAAPANKLNGIVQNKLVITAVVIALLASAVVGLLISNKRDTGGASLNDISRDIKNATDLSEALKNIQTYTSAAEEKVMAYQRFSESIDAADENIMAKNNELKHLTEQLTELITGINERVNSVSDNNAAESEEKLTEIKQLSESEEYINISLLSEQCDNKMNEINEALRVNKEQAAKEAPASEKTTRQNYGGSRTSGSNSDNTYSENKSYGATGNSGSQTDISSNNSSNTSQSGQTEQTVSEVQQENKQSTFDGGRD